METRSRKRAEATSSGPTTRSIKRTRHSRSDNNMDNDQQPSGSNSTRRRSSNKGKEKDDEQPPPPRVRVSDDDDVADDDVDSDGGGGGGMFNQNLTTASSALQGLLRKLGAGLDDLLPSSAMASGSSSQQNGRLKKILSGLRADGEEGRQVESLTQLCEILSIGTEDSLSSFSVDSLCDVLPSSCVSVVHYGAVSCFVARLLTIEYMDLAEQRVALSTAANMCKKLPSDAADFVMEAVPLLTNLLQYHDAKIFEIVNLTNELLPPLPQGIISLPSSSNLFIKGPLSRKSPVGSSVKQEETTGHASDMSGREKLLTDQPELLQQFGMDLLPVLIQIYGSSVNAPVRHKCLSAIGKLFYFSSADMIQSLLGATNISSLAIDANRN
nr:E3 ubiquitin-protein ligase UPL3 [Tanacetum cinerariifolium]